MILEKMIQLTDQISFSGWLLLDNMCILIVCEAGYDVKNFKINLKIKVTLKGLMQLLATEGLLKMIKNAFYFTLKALFVLKIFKFLS